MVSLSLTVVSCVFLSVSAAVTVTTTFLPGSGKSLVMFSGGKTGWPLESRACTDSYVHVLPTWSGSTFPGQTEVTLAGGFACAKAAEGARPRPRRAARLASERMGPWSYCPDGPR